MCEMTEEARKKRKELMLALDAYVNERVRDVLAKVGEGTGNPIGVMDFNLVTIADLRQKVNEVIEKVNRL